MTKKSLAQEKPSYRMRQLGFFLASLFSFCYGMYGVIVGRIFIGSRGGGRYCYGSSTWFFYVFFLCVTVFLILKAFNLTDKGKYVYVVALIGLVWFVSGALGLAFCVA